MLGSFCCLLFVLFLSKNDITYLKREELRIGLWACSILVIMYKNKTVLTTIAEYT